MNKMGRQMEGYGEGVQWSHYGYVSVVSCSWCNLLVAEKLTSSSSVTSC